MSGTADFLQAPVLAMPDVAHGFFTRNGGVSTGVYASLNGGVGSRDEPAAVSENRARMARALGVSPDRLLVPYQAHTPDAVAVEAPWAEGERPRCDGFATATPGLALGVTGADCGVLLFADPKARVIGAAHAGWKGALDGVVEATVAAMERLGARRTDIAATLGPTIAQKSYEVGPEFVARFVTRDADFQQFFIASEKARHAMFDLPGFIGMRVARAEIGAFQDLALDTYADPERFFSYRRATHLGEPDYGRLVAAIALRRA
jgi:YfiH family protein